MSNQVTRSPYVIDADATTVWDSNPGKWITLIQWVDDSSDILDTHTLVLVIDGQTFTGAIQLGANTVNNLVVWELAFPSPQFIQKFVVTTIDEGELVIWEA